MTLTNRDRKVLFALIPIALVAAYWLLVLAPKRHEAAGIQDQLTQAQSERDTAVHKAANLTAAKRSFSSDYATVIYLGKSIPSTVDMPSLLVQLDRAARGTGIQFTSIKTGDRDAASTTGGGTSTSAPPSGGGSSGGSTGTPPNGGGGPANSSTPAQSAPGGAAQSAGNAVNTSNNSSAAATGSQPPASAPTAGGADQAAGASSQPGLDTVPLDFEFDGSFFRLADFFHRMKRFVRVANDRIIVRGRLMTINSFSFDAKENFPSIKATVHATVYLAPKAEGVSAGATPQGPAGQAVPPAQSTSSSPSTSTPPAAAVTAP